MLCNSCYAEMPFDNLVQSTDVFICPACNAAPRFTYVYTIHPPMVGTQPDGWVERNRFRGIRGLEKRMVEGFPVPVWGTVSYTHPLDIEQCWRLDLVPLDMGERAKYFEVNRRHAVGVYD